MLAFAAQVLIQGVAHLGFIQAKQHVDAGRLDIGIDDADPLARPGQPGQPGWR